jgi:transporter family-2 protein
MSSYRLLMWAFAAGALIPVMAVLNARMGRSLHTPLHAPVILFVVALTACLVGAWLLTQRLPQVQDLRGIRPVELIGGLIVVFYVTSATLLAPQIGVANFIFLAVTAQIFSSLAIDHFGLFGAMQRPVNASKLMGAVLLLGGLVLTQVSDNNSGR